MLEVLTPHLLCRSDSECWTSYWNGFNSRHHYCFDIHYLSYFLGIQKGVGNVKTSHYLTCSLVSTFSRYCLFIIVFVYHCVCLSLCLFMIVFVLSFISADEFHDGSDM